ncbi:MAG: DUF4325 domain-containing protein [Clostridia bacterium]|nr:DUF4325 domain-containing protein [Clostridia bacterium]
MKFNAEKTNMINMYILEKIDAGSESLSASVADAFGISTNTVHSYLRRLQEDSVIVKAKRGEYKLVTNSVSYELSRSAGDLDTDTYAFDAFFEKHIKDLPENVYRIWEYAFSEMINNVVDHSAAENLNILVEQNYLNTSVFIIDNGIGIFNKIREHFSLPGIDEAICELFKGKLTTDSSNHSGEGIFFSSKMMDKFFIYSSGRIFTTSKYNNDEIFDIDLGESFSGTAVYMSLSNFSQRHAADVFDQYASVDGGFTKTRIPLKNIFDTAPISRSQAKRVCNRLDSFLEVEIDFDGLDWMGQGFAHQMFVVYQNAHPDIKLIPTNMSENVQKMYNHVTS